MMQLAFDLLSEAVVLILSDKEMNRRKDMLANLRSKVNQMKSTLNMSNFTNRDSLLGPESKPVDAMSRASGLDNHGVAEQDEGLEKLEDVTPIQTDSTRRMGGRRGRRL
ncbi:hypothetical protein AgCh_019427 [Apium graveolens]